MRIARPVQLFIAITVLATADASFAQPVKAGDVFKIFSRYENEEKREDGSSSSSGQTAIIERVIRVDERGLELEYDEFPAEDGTKKGANWQLPARIFRPFEGEPSLLNTEELESRVDPWLKKAKFPRAACGQWIFTWNAFKIECDPVSALGIVKQYDLWTWISDRMPYSDPYASAPSPIRLRTSNAEGATYTVELAVDPEKVRLAEAESEVVVGKIMGDNKSLEDALLNQADRKISGIMSVEIETDPAGLIVKKTTVTKLDIAKSDGDVESRTSTVTVERERLPASALPQPQ
ncbi:hypothetical protein [Sphingorhabdus sp.]|uniref:hypothetical protein n=1 Tax=Sphingorhabdus sp. TaxID=1902408 RepID=UPI0032B709C3